MQNLPVLVAVILAFTVCAATAANKTFATEEEFHKSILDQEKKEAFNKALVLGLMNEVFGDKDIDAMDKYIDGENYIQHNPSIADGREAVKAFMNKHLKHLPKNTIEIQRVAAEGDIVFFHWKSTQIFDKVASIIDVFRIENQKVVEHWDVIQFVAAESATSANAHPFF